MLELMELLLILEDFEERRMTRERSGAIGLRLRRISLITFFSTLRSVFSTLRFTIAVRRHFVFSVPVLSLQAALRARTTLFMRLSALLSFSAIFFLAASSIHITFSRPFTSAHAPVL